MAIMKLGTHKAMDGREISFTADMLNDIATSYDPQLSEAPIVIGHPKLTAPSYGWVKQASIEGNTLYAHVGQVEAAFADAVNEGRYKKRSASIFLPDSPGNPKPGHYYLNHIGFLGAAPPAVKGLGDVNFAASDAENAFAEFSFDIESINHQPQENPMDKTPEEIAAEKAADKQREDDLKAREAALKAREDKVEKAEKAQKQAEKAALEQDAASFASEMVSKGKVLPAQKQALIEVLVASANQPISFSDGSQTVSKSSIDVIKEIISQKPMDFSAKSNEEGEEQGAVDFSDGASIASAASEYAAEQAQKGIVISMTDAVNHIMKGKKS